MFRCLSFLFLFFFILVRSSFAFVPSDKTVTISLSGSEIPFSEIESFRRAMLLKTSKGFLYCACGYRFNVVSNVISVYPASQSFIVSTEVGYYGDCLFGYLDHWVTDMGDYFFINRKIFDYSLDLQRVLFLLARFADNTSFFFSAWDYNRQPRPFVKDSNFVSFNSLIFSHILPYNVSRSQWYSMGCNEPLPSKPQCPNVHIRSLPAVRVRVRC